MDRQMDKLQYGLTDIRYYERTIRRANSTIYNSALAMMMVWQYRCFPILLDECLFVVWLFLIL